MVAAADLFILDHGTNLVKRKYGQAVADHGHEKPVRKQVATDGKRRRPKRRSITASPLVCLEAEVESNSGSSSADEETDVNLKATKYDLAFINDDSLADSNDLARDLYNQQARDKDDKAISIMEHRYSSIATVGEYGETPEDREFVNDMYVSDCSGSGSDESELSSPTPVPPRRTRQRRRLISVADRADLLHKQHHQGWETKILVSEMSPSGDTAALPWGQDEKNALQLATRRAKDLVDTNTQVTTDPWSPTIETNSNIKLKEVDFQTLHGLCWVNDEIINAYLAVISKHATASISSTGHAIPAPPCKFYLASSFFMAKLTQLDPEGGKTCDRVRRWLRREVITFWGPQAVHRMLCPVHLRQSHWIAIVIDFKIKTVFFCDSMSASLDNDEVVELFEWLMFYLQDQFDHQQKERMKQQEVETQDPEEFDSETWSWRLCNGPQQSNSSDCGAFTLNILKRYSNDYSKTRAIQCMLFMHHKQIDVSWDYLSWRVPRQRESRHRT
jgi:hypothetical protein